MDRTMVRVVKLGGSLLDFDRLGENFARWIAHEPPGHDVVIVGGGALADWVRGADRRYQLGEALSHQLCIELMGITAGLVAPILPEAKLVDDYGALRDRIGRPGLTVYDTQSFLRDIEPHLEGTRLPKTWSVTSDSIAARLAVVLGADELVFLKSALPAASVTLGELTKSCYVDRFMIRLEREIPPLRLVNLRSAATLAVAGRPAARLPESC